MNPQLVRIVKVLLYIVHPESFRSNAQKGNRVCTQNRPHVNRSDRLRAFICVRLRLRAFACVASTVCDRVRARTCV